MKNFNILSSIAFLIILLSVNSCDMTTKSDENNNDYLIVHGAVSITLKYIKYDRYIREVQLEAFDKSIYNLSFPFYRYGISYDPSDNSIHQQFVKWTKDGFEPYCPLSIDFDYDENDSTFRNIYAEFCVYDTILQECDSSRLIIIEGLNSD